MKKKLKCFVCHKEINEEEDYVFKGQTVHKGECLKSMIDEYNAVRNLQIRNKRLCVEIERLNNKYSKALELLIDYNLPCEVDDFMNVHSDYCETHCGVDEEQYKRCWNKFIEWKLGSDKE